MHVLYLIRQWVWEIMKELLGGEGRIDQPSASWGDSFAVNPGTEKIDAAESKALNNWRVDDDLFMHPHRRELADWNLKTHSGPLSGLSRTELFPP